MPLATNERASLFCLYEIVPAITQAVGEHFRGAQIQARLGELSWLAYEAAQSQRQSFWPRPEFLSRRIPAAKVMLVPMPPVRIHDSGSMYVFSI